MTGLDEEGFYRTDRPAREESGYEPVEVPGWIVPAVVCSLVFALGLAAGVLLSLIVLG